MITTRKFARHSFVFLLAVLLQLSSLPVSGREVPAPRPRTAAPSSDTAAALNEQTTRTPAFGRLPLRFETNQGQTAAAVKYLARVSGYTLFLTGTEAVMAMRNAGCGTRHVRCDGTAQAVTETLKIKFADANPAPQITGLAQQPGTSSYFVGNDPRQWRTEVPAFAGVAYREIYPGVDLLWYGNEQALEYDFVVAPGADPRAIRLQFDGARRLRVAENGDLLIRLAHGEMRQHKPVLYQDSATGRQLIPGRYVISQRRGKQEVSFLPGRYDHKLPLIIDPVLSYSTLLGGSGNDNGQGIAVDSLGNVYVTGFTASTSFPGAARVPAGSTGGNGDVFVTKLNAAGSQIVWSAYIGGTGAEAATDLALDATNNVWLTGFTNSTDFPTVNPRQGSSAGGAFDAFVLKLNSTGSTLSFSTYLGGPGDGSANSGDDRGFGIAVDSGGSAVVTGQTNSASFPLQNPLRNTNSGGFDGFIAKYSSDGATITFATYLGGQNDDVAQKVAVDSSNNIYVTGFTLSPNFPTTTPLQGTNNGNRDVFVTKLNATGTAFSFSTYLGGGADEIGYGIATDSTSNVYVSGVTSSANFPLQNPAQTQFGGGGTDAFVTKINAAGSALVYSTWIGGSGDDYASRVAVDSTGSATFTGNTFSPDFPLENTIPGTAGSGSDAFVVRLNAAGSARVFSTYLGGNGEDFGNSIALDSAGNIYITGDSGSSSFPTAAALQASSGGGSDAFILRIDPSRNLTNFVTVSAASFQGAQIAPDSIVAGFGPNVASGLALPGSATLPTELGGISIRIRDANGNEQLCPLFFVSQNQINYQIPASVVAGRASISVINTSTNQPVSAGVVNIATIGPGLFTADASGSGAPAAFAIRVTGSGQQIFESVSNGATPIQLDPGPPDEQIFLILFGTGIRGRSAQNGVTVNYLAGGSVVAATGVEYASVAPGFVGLDQINLILPRTLIGRGLLDLAVIVDSRTTNSVKINIK